eukprot:TRINITY_DN4634_c0_g1_i2.p1 TRINITY_DN4634_c0_g1~~TRINITY_DN4634_c0_g1_i2.p1  ORF type:complete len:635 (-),score=132.18 TRINITY_DN4634_c0_g1_i2:386-2290(-)
MLRLASLSLNLHQSKSKADSPAALPPLWGCAAPQIDSVVVQLKRSLTCGDEQKACKLISENKLASCKFDKGFTPLMYAAASNLLVVIQLLLEQGANVDEQNEFGDTALHLAAKSGKAEATKILLQHKADSLILNSDGFSAAHLAVKSKSLSVVKQLPNASFLLPSLDGQMPIHCAILSDLQDIIDHLLNFPNQHTLSTSTGLTTLHLASMRGQLHTVQTLVEKDVNVNAQDQSGNTPLHMAAKSKSQDIIETLLGYGADARIANNTGVVCGDLLPSECYEQPERKQQSSPASQVPSIQLASFPPCPFPVQLSFRKRPIESCVVPEEPLQFSLNVVGGSDIVVKAQARHAKYPKLQSGSGHINLAGEVEKAQTNFVNFNNLKLKHQSKNGPLQFQFLAYENYGTKDQKLVGFSQATPVNLAESQSARRMQALNGLWKNAGSMVMHPKSVVCWERLRESIRQQFSRTLGLGCRPLSPSDLDYLSARMNQGMPMLATASVELIAFQTHCWEWLWSAMQYLVSHPLQLLLWNLGYFYSLTEREEAAAKLTQAGPDAVMLRLSCTQPGCVVIGKNNRDGCGVSWLKLTADELSDGHRLINRLLETKGKVVVGANGRHLPLEPLEKHSTKATPGYVPLFN